jgi:hypothetical protein
MLIFYREDRQEHDAPLTHTNAEGRFALTLHPGRYRVVVAGSPITPVPSRYEGRATTPLWVDIPAAGLKDWQIPLQSDRPSGPGGMPGGPPKGPPGGKPGRPLLEPPPSDGPDPA